MDINEIGNNALALIGAQEIVTIADDVKSAKIIKRRYVSLRKSCLRRYKWNFAIKRVTLSVPDGTAPVYDYTYRFALPSDYLRILSSEDMLPYEVEGAFITTYDNPLNIRYIADIIDYNIWDPLFTDYYTHVMAGELAYPLLQDKGMVDLMKREAKSIITEAKNINSIERWPVDYDGVEGDHLEANEWINSRY